MKVLMFGWEFPPHMSGGLGTACEGLSRALSHQKVDVTFVLPKLADNVQHEGVVLLAANQVKVLGEKRRIKSFKHSIEILEVDSPLRPYLNGSEYERLVKRLRKGRVIEAAFTEKPERDSPVCYGDDMMSEIVKYSIVAGEIARTRRFDVIHAHDWMTFLAGIEARKVSGKPLIVHVHSLEHDRGGNHADPNIERIERAGLEAADVIIAVSFYTQEKLIKHYGIPLDKIRVVHNAVSSENRLAEHHVRKNEKEKVVLFMGRVTAQKGPEYFIDAAKMVIDRMRNVRFVMAGTGDLFPQMVDRVARLRMGKHFHFTGFLRAGDVERMYAMSDLYVMPSVSEPFGITPLEAITYNVPIIISRQSGIAEVLNHAITIDSWDIQKLAENIVMILTNPVLAAEMVEKSRKQLTLLKWELAAEKVCAIYKEMAITGL